MAIYLSIYLSTSSYLYLHEEPGVAVLFGEHKTTTLRSIQFDKLRRLLNMFNESINLCIYPSMNTSTSFYL